MSGLILAIALCGAPKCDGPLCILQVPARAAAVAPVKVAAGAAKVAAKAVKTVTAPVKALRERKPARRLLGKLLPPYKRYRCGG